MGAVGGPHPLLSRPDVGRDIRKGEGRVAERQQCGGSDGELEMLREKCLDWREDMGDVGCCWEAGKRIRSTAELGSQVDSCILLSSSSPFYFRVQGDVELLLVLATFRILIYVIIYLF